MHEDFQRFQGNVFPDLNLSARKNGRGYTVPKCRDRLHATEETIHPKNQASMRTLQ